MVMTVMGAVGVAGAEGAVGAFVCGCGEEGEKVSPLGSAVVGAELPLADEGLSVGLSVVVDGAANGCVVVGLWVPIGAVVVISRDGVGCDETSISNGEPLGCTVLLMVGWSECCTALGAVVGNVTVGAREGDSERELFVGALD